MSQSISNNSIVARILRSVAGAPREVYSPSDDSFLMLDALSKQQLEGKDVLDVGTGSGILALYSAMRGATVTATDINQKALDHAARAARDLKVELRLIISDIFSNVVGQFDLITFNPPYLPSNQTVDITTDGGKRGQAIAERFLADLGHHVKQDGTALMILTGANDLMSVGKRYDAFQFSIIATKHLFFEELRVLQLRLRQNAAR